MSFIQNSSVLGTTTFANLPTAGTAGRPMFVSDIGPHGSVWVDGGDIWRPESNQLLLAIKDTSQSGITNSESTVLATAALPASFFRVTDTIRVFYSAVRSGTTDTSSLRTRLGTAGTSADTSLGTHTVIASTNLVSSSFIDYRLESDNGSNSTWQQIGRTDFGYGGVTTNGAASTVTTAPAISTASLKLSAGFVSAGATNTITAQKVEILLIRSPN